MVLRNNCAHDPRCETVYYTVQHKVNGSVGRCAFYGDKLDKDSTKTVKTLLQKEYKVLPSCGKPVCLSMNPKSNFQLGWTVKEKQTRKRKATNGSNPESKKAKQTGKKRKRKKS